MAIVILPDAQADLLSRLKPATRAEFQEPIVIGNPDEDNHDDEGVNIIGIVLRSHQTLYKRRR